MKIHLQTSPDPAIKNHGGCTGIKTHEQCLFFFYPCRLMISSGRIRNILGIVFFRTGFPYWIIYIIIPNIWTNMNQLLYIFNNTQEPGIPFWTNNTQGTFQQRIPSRAKAIDGFHRRHVATCALGIALPEGSRLDDDALRKRKRGVQLVIYMEMVNGHMVILIYYVSIYYWVISIIWWY